jgi:hypothetical protein
MSEEGHEHEGKKAKKKKAAEPQTGSQDPYLVDPVGTTQARIEGTTSDAAQHTEGNLASETPPDPPTYDDKASDAEDYAFPVGGDVDVATVDPGSGEGELIPVPSVEEWVVLDGSAEEVPDALAGRRAVVLSIEPRQDFYTQEEWDAALLTVRTRDDYAATIVVPTTAVESTHKLNPQRL